MDLSSHIVALADACVRCGLCLPHCPTYQLDRIEAESPRGRIMQWRALATGALAPSATAQAHLDHCLACRNCEPVCPAGVRYGALLVAGRALQREQSGSGWRQRALQWLVAHPAALAAAAAAARAAHPLLPRPLGTLAAGLAPPRRWPLRTPAQGQPRGRVGLLLGCVGRHAQPAAIDAALQVLSRLGFEVLVAPAQRCCGALARHAGDDAGADALALESARAFADHGAERVLVLDSGCVESLRLGAADMQVDELLQFVAGAMAAGDADGRPPLPLQPPDSAAGRETIALHLPCTQRNVTFAAGAAQALLAALPGVRVELVGGAGCCGAAGSQLALDAGRAARFRAPLLEEVRASGATTLASGNVGCRMHLQAGLREAGLGGAGPGDAGPGEAGPVEAGLREVGRGGERPNPAGAHGPRRRANGDRSPAVRVVHPIELLAQRLLPPR